MPVCVWPGQRKDKWGLDGDSNGMPPEYTSELPVGRTGLVRVRNIILRTTFSNLNTFLLIPQQ
jgi:hypothetical protein